MMTFKPDCPNVYSVVKENREKRISKEENIRKRRFYSEYQREKVRLPKIISNIENVIFEHV